MFEFGFRKSALAIVFAATGVLPLGAQELPMEGPVATTVLINAQSKHDEALNPNSLKLEVNGHGTPIESISQVRPGALQVAVLIDDGLRGSFGLQIEELQKFITQLPAGAQVLLGYMQNGTVRSRGQFSPDHAEVAGDLRIPLSAPGVSASPYFCLSEFVKHWPSAQRGARMVLMLTNGVDPYNGSVSPLNQNSPYVERAQNDAQRAGVAVYSIYYGDRGIGGQAASFSGQNYLSQIAEATGGQTFNQGTITPPSLRPYLQQFNRALRESYVVGFRARGNADHPKELSRVKLKTSQSGIKLHVPEGVRVGSAE